MSLLVESLEDRLLLDATPPVLTVPGTIFAEATSAAGAVVDYVASATDPEDGALTPTCSPASGSTFPLGTTPVTCAASDSGGNTALATFPVSVQDTRPPVFDHHPDVTVETTSADGATVIYTSPTTRDEVDGEGTGRCSPVSGSTFPVGRTRVTCTAADSVGNTSVYSFDVFVVYTIPLTIDTHENVTVEATSPAGAEVTYLNPATHDATGGIGTAMCMPASGSTFPLGATRVNCTATDAAGNMASSFFDVFVVDRTAPTIEPHDTMKVEATSAAGSVVTYNVATHDAVDGDSTATCSPFSGSTFPLGATRVTCTATDAVGNTANSFFDVFVEAAILVDTTAPTIEPHDRLTGEATSAAGAMVSYTSPVTYDAVSGDSTATCSPASGSTFPLGTTRVTCTAADAAGNTASSFFDVFVVDTTAPIIEAHDNMRVEATSAAGAMVSYSSPATHDAVSGDATATCSPTSDSTFPLGTTRVSCTATDAAGNTASSFFDVFVVDTTVPTIDLHADISAEAISPDGVAVSYTSPATHDAVSGDGVASCTPASGSRFAVGKTPVTCAATDAAGNAAAPVSFMVSVNLVRATISGRSFLDLDGDGIQDADEPGLRGWTVNLFRDADGNGAVDTRLDQLVGTQMTDPAGAYSFANLLPGTYFARELLQAGFTYTSPTRNVTASGGEVFANQDFGNRPPAVSLIADPWDLSQTALLVVGTSGNDKISFVPGPKSRGNANGKGKGDSGPPGKGRAPGTVVVSINNVTLGSFSPTGRIIAYGRAGDDNINMANGIQLPTVMYGGAGNDMLNGGNLNDILLGDAGNDRINGQGGNDVLIGGRGLDRINGGDGNDLLVGGFTDFDARYDALAAIIAEWSAARDYDSRVGNLRGGSGGGANGSFYLNAATVHDDAIIDMLTGGMGQDWFLACKSGPMRDIVTGIVVGEYADAI